MESKAGSWAVEAEEILERLLEFAAQIAEFARAPEVDIKALSEECAKQTEVLKRLVPEDFEDSAAANREILEKMRALHARTQLCLEVLHEKSEAVSTKLQSLSRMRQAVSAYSRQRHYSR